MLQANGVPQTFIIDQKTCHIRRVRNTDQKVVDHHKLGQHTKPNSYLYDFPIPSQTLYNLLSFWQGFVDIVVEDPALPIEVPPLEQFQQALLVPQLEGRLEHIPLVICHLR